MYPNSQFGNPLHLGIVAKKNKSAIGMSYLRGYFFDQNRDNGNISKLSLSFLHKSGFEFSFIKSLNDINQNLLINNIQIESDQDLTYDIASFTMHMKEKKYGVSIHFATYKPNLKSLHTRNPKEYGISFHKRFRKKVHRPFIYYSFIDLYNGTPQYEYLAFGNLITINSMVLGTYISVPIGWPINFVNDEAQFNLALGLYFY